MTELPEIDLHVESETIELKERKLKADWKCQTYMGFEAYWFPEGLAGREVYDCRCWPRHENGEPLYHKMIGGSEHLKMGDKILVKCMSDYAWRPMTIIELNGPNEAWAEDETETASTIYRKPDDRDAWVSMGLMCLKGLRNKMPILGNNNEI